MWTVTEHSTVWKTCVQVECINVDKCIPIYNYSVLMSYVVSSLEAMYRQECSHNHTD